MDVEDAVAWVEALHCYGDSNGGDNNDAGDDSNGGDRDGDNTHSYVRDRRDVDAESGVDEAAVPLDVVAMADAEAAVQMQ